MHNRDQPSPNSSEPSVTAVIPAYNAADTIERALNSVYAQTYDNIIEVIVVDDGSKDNTAEIIRNKFPEVTLIQQGNAGRSMARNRGVGSAASDYIAFLDADDEWFPEKTAAQMACFARYEGLHMVIADAVWILGDGKHTDSVNDGVVQPLIFCEVFPSFGFNYGPPSWIFERSLFERCGGFSPDLLRGEDAEWLWRVLLKGFSVARFRKTLCRCFPSNWQGTAKYRATCWRTWYDAVAPIVEEYAQRACQIPALMTVAEAEERVSDFDWTATWHLWEQGAEGEARECLNRAIQGTRASGLKALRHRLAAWNPGLYHALARPAP